MIITLDYPNSDPNYMLAIGQEDENFQLYDYVKIVYHDKIWIGQIKSPNLNISTVSGIDPFNPTLIHTLLMSIQHPEIQLRMLDSTEKWMIYLMGEYNQSSEMLTMLRTRPKPPASVIKLDRDITVQILNLPTLELRENQTTNAIGVLENADNVPLCVNPQILNHHILVSGGTGSGKSNACANIIAQACEYGYCVILYDAKPDYRLMDEVNSERKVESVFERFREYHVTRQPIKSLKRVCFYAGEKKDYSHYDTVLGFHASDFDSVLFMNLILPETASEMQRDEFFLACNQLRQEMYEKKRKSFSLNDIQEWLKERCTFYAQQKDKAGLSPVKAVLRNVTRKIKNNEFPWLDQVGTQLSRRNDFEPARYIETFNPQELVESGTVVHVFVGGENQENYALFLSLFFNYCQDYRRKKGNTTPIVQFVDEAHRIFDNQGKHKGRLANTFNRTMREGRTLEHGVILSLQNAKEVPSNVMNNLNSHIVMRQNNIEIAKSATQMMGKEEAYRTPGLASGQALVKFFESGSVALVQMAPSPFELERPDNKHRVVERGLA